MRARRLDRPATRAKYSFGDLVGGAVSFAAAGFSVPATRKPKEVPLASTVEIAPRTEADLPLLFGLAKGAFVDLPGWSDERVLEVLRRDVTFVAREQGQPAGYVSLRRKENGAIVIEQLFVASGHERRGIGRRLLAHAEGYAIAERAQSLQIVVEEGNQRARSFYRRSGFVPVEPELLELVLPRAD
jgi:ribosomal protein S18 acetylase RimI-like enzyme